jgi:drug/metabolite transporter (DMT)-like permease
MPTATERPSLTSAETSKRAVAEQSLLPYWWMLIGSASFALMGTMARALRVTCDWQVIALARSGLPLLFAAAFALAAGAKLVFWWPRTLWIRSIAGSLSMMGTFFALTRLPVYEVFTLTNMFPIWVAVLSWPLLGELPPGRVWLAVASGVVGVVLIQQPHFARGNFACLVALACSLCTAVAMIGLHRLHGLHTWSIVAHFSGVALVFSVVCFFLFDRALPPENALHEQPLLLLVGVGVTATVGQLCLTKAFAAGPPAKISVISLTQIVFAMILEWILFGHTFNADTLLGIVLVVVPTAWLMARRW